MADMRDHNAIVREAPSGGLHAEWLLEALVAGHIEPIVRMCGTIQVAETTGILMPFILAVACKAIEKGFARAAIGA